MFSNFQATVPLISCEYTQNSEKYDKTFGTKIRVGLKKKGGWCCGSCQAALRIWPGFALPDVDLLTKPKYPTPPPPPHFECWIKNFKKCHLQSSYHPHDASKTAIQISLYCAMIPRIPSDHNQYINPPVWHSVQCGRLKIHVHHKHTHWLNTILYIHVCTFGHSKPFSSASKGPNATKFSQIQAYLCY